MRMATPPSTRSGSPRDSAASSGRPASSTTSGLIAVTGGDDISALGCVASPALAADEHSLQLRERVHRIAPAHPADAALAAGAAAPGQVRLPVVRRLVHVHQA